MTSAFIIEVNSELQPNPNQETAALLRVLVHKVDNTAFGNDVPTIPQPWTGPPHVMVQVQTILFASLAASLFSAFLAMLGKQWLNRYASVDMRGSAIERSRNRQRKLDGIISWYFDHVMESLPLMLQVALLLLGCALSRYFWEINRTVASVIIGVTLFGVLFYVFIVFAGAIFVNCPYQTPGANIIRHVPNIFPLIYSVSSTAIKISSSLEVIASAWRGRDDPCVFICMPLFILYLPITLVWDVCAAILLLSVAFFFGVRSLLQQVYSQLQRVYSHLQQVYSQLQQGLEQQTATLDAHCILWALRTSLDEPVRVSTLNYLATTTLAAFDPTLVVDCFDILLGCIKVTDFRAEIIQGMEQLATASVLCCLHTLSHLAVTGPEPRVFENIRRRYTRVFSLRTKLDGLPFSYVMGVIHGVFYPVHRDRFIELVLSRARDRWQINWEDYKPSSNEYIMVARALVKLARFEYQKRRNKKVPRRFLRFALWSLSQSPPPSTSVVINCLLIIMIDLGCDFAITTTSDGHTITISENYETITTSDERCVHTS